MFGREEKQVSVSGPGVVVAIEPPCELEQAKEALRTIEDEIREADRRVMELTGDHQRAMLRAHNPPLDAEPGQVAEWMNEAAAILRLIDAARRRRPDLESSRKRADQRVKEVRQAGDLLKYRLTVCRGAIDEANQREQELEQQLRTTRHARETRQQDLEQLQAAIRHKLGEQTP